MIKKMIMVLLLLFCVIPVIAQENDMPITREQRIYKDSEARYFRYFQYKNYNHPVYLSDECSLEDASLSGQRFTKAWFDKNNNITRWELHDNMGKIIEGGGATEYQYDSKGRLSLVLLLDENNNIKRAIPWK